MKLGFVKWIVKILGVFEIYPLVDWTVINNNEKRHIWGSSQEKKEEKFGGFLNQKYFSSSYRRPISISVICQFQKRYWFFYSFRSQTLFTV